jgi:hypothetical protein
MVPTDTLDALFNMVCMAQLEGWTFARLRFAMYEVIGSLPTMEDVAELQRQIDARDPDQFVDTMTRKIGFANLPASRTHFGELQVSSNHTDLTSKVRKGRGIRVVTFPKSALRFILHALKQVLAKIRLHRSNDGHQHD